MLLVTSMASASLSAARDFAHSTCRHFALLLASGWGRLPSPPLPPSSKYTSYPVLDGVPAHVGALRHLDPHSILEAFQEVRPDCHRCRCAEPLQDRHFDQSASLQGFVLMDSDQRGAVLGCMSVFLETLDVVTSAQQGFIELGHATVAGALTVAASFCCRSRHELSIGYHAGHGCLACRTWSSPGPIWRLS